MPPLASATPASNEADTVVLSMPSAARPQVPPARARLFQRVTTLRRQILILVVIFLGAFTAVKIVSCLNASAGSPYANRATTSPPAATVPAAPAYPPSGTEPPVPEFLAPRLAAFRRALNMRGFNTVQFRMVGSTMQLWGTVPDDWSHIQVEAMANAIVGVVSFDDHIQVRNGFGSP